MREEKDDGKRRMHQAWQHILDGLCTVMKQDAKGREDAFTEQLTVEQFAKVLLSQILSALLRQDYDPSAVLKIIRRKLLLRRHSTIRQASRLPTRWRSLGKTAEAAVGENGSFRKRERTLCRQS